MDINPHQNEARPFVIVCICSVPPPPYLPGCCLDDSLSQPQLNVVLIRVAFVMVHSSRTLTKKLYQGLGYCCDWPDQNVNFRTLDLESSGML